MSSRTPFTRQLAPVLGGKHVNDDQSDKNEGMHSGNRGIE